MKFVKEVPPSQIHSIRTYIDDEVDELKKHPGQWALVRETANSGSAASYKKRGCEVQTRTTVGYENSSSTDRRFDIYARWPKS